MQSLFSIRQEVLQFVVQHLFKNCLDQPDSQRPAAWNNQVFGHGKLQVCGHRFWSIKHIGIVAVHVNITHHSQVVHISKYCWFDGMHSESCLRGKGCCEKSWNIKAQSDWWLVIPTMAWNNAKIYSNSNIRNTSPIVHHSRHCLVWMKMLVWSMPKGILTVYWTYSVTSDLTCILASLLTSY